MAAFIPWFEDRGPQSCLLTLVDDATGRSLGRFGAQETIRAAVAILVASAPARPPARPVQPAPVAARQRRPGADHPWRRAVAQFRIDQQLDADRKAYAAVNP